jgi:hypothetical protein
MNRKYQIAGHLFEVSGEKLCEAVAQIEGFRPFEVAEGEPVFGFQEGKVTDVPEMAKVEYTLEYEGVKGTFGRTAEGFRLNLQPEAEGAFDIWFREGETVVYLGGNWSVLLYRFALWVAYGLMTLQRETLAIHSSCIVYQNKAVLFLGESGTGKSTHTRLWREHIGGAVLLNDDSPMIRVEEGKVWAYGSAWSGKTPCYKQERYELVACVRLSQAPYNRIQKLSVLQAYGAIHPSCAPEFAYDDALYDEVSRIIGRILSVVPCYHLACLPDREAALLSCQTIFGE